MIILIKTGMVRAAQNGVTQKSELSTPTVITDLGQFLLFHNKKILIISANGFYLLLLQTENYIHS